MDKPLDFILGFKTLPEPDVLRMEPLTLAFVGDAVHHLYVRTRLVCTQSGTVHRLHMQAARYVKASAQADTLNAQLPTFTETEQTVFRRGRNAKPGTVPRNASVKDYHDATGFEAVLGFLYLTGQTVRLAALLEAAWPSVE